MEDYDFDERLEELDAIKAIFDELIIDSSNPYHSTLEISVSPREPLAIRFGGAADGASSSITPPSHSTATNAAANHVPVAPLPGAYAAETYYLENLPPLLLDIRLPSGYPFGRPPYFRLSTKDHWLPNSILNELRAKATELWEELKDQVVFTYIDELQGTIENGFRLRPTDPPRILDVPLELRIALLDFDIRAKREKFEKETFNCGVCLEPKKGSVCYRLQKCGHVFCVSCLQDFYNNCITTGDVDRVRCLDPDCGKEKHVTNNDAAKNRRCHTLNPNELLAIPLEQEVVQRYVSLKRKKRLESNPNTIYCPRSWCQGPARRSNNRSKTGANDGSYLSDSDSEGENEDDSPSSSSKSSLQGDPLRICEDCSYAFCAICKQGWHGDYVRCFPRDTAELTEEEKASEEYMRLHTSPCPTCNAPSQKTHGCNHMICFRCKTHFCYLCSAWLSPDNPYEHFNNKKNGCYMRLWELEDGDGGENIDIGFAGGEADDEVIMMDLAEDDEHDVRERLMDLFVEAHLADEVVENDDEAPPPAPPPPPAPVPPRRRRHGRVNPNPIVNIHRPVHNNNNDDHDNDHAHAGAHRRRDRQQNHNHPERRAAGAENPNVNPGANRAQDLPHGHGIRRFLELVQNDEEDEWDSDELEDEFDFGLGGDWDIPVR